MIALKKQKELINKFKDENRSTLAFFDAARYDIFEELLQESGLSNLDVTLQKVKGGATFTFDWFQLNFPEDHAPYPITLYTAVPFMNMGPNNMDVVHRFQRNVNWNSFSWNEKLGTVFPDQVNQVVIDDLMERKDRQEKKIIRYFQPHPPFLKDGWQWTKKPGKAKRAKQKLQKGEITLEELREAYKDNMKRAFEAFESILSFLPEKIYLTADHGEALGEEWRGNRRFYHRRSMDTNNPALGELPWLEIPAHEDRDIEVEDEVKQRLQDLGYL